MKHGHFLAPTDAYDILVAAGSGENRRTRSLIELSVVLIGLEKIQNGGMYIFVTGLESVALMFPNDVQNCEWLNTSARLICGSIA